jgi:hypothetical protein
LRAATSAGTAIMVVTKQAGIGRGIFTEQKFCVLTNDDCAVHGTRCADQSCLFLPTTMCTVTGITSVNALSGDYGSDSERAVEPNR